MCFVLLLHRVLPDAPTVLVANRDEEWARPSAPPRLWPAAPGSAPFVAPLDVRAGGTWLGVNAAGTVVAVTNRPAGTPDPARESRGRLVVDLLHAGTFANVRDLLLASDPARYNPCNLLVVDAEHAHAFALEDSLRETELTAGMHVLTNRGEVDSEFTSEIEEHFDPIGAAATRSRQDLAAHLLAIAADRTVHSTRGEPICQVHEQRGTVSTALVTLGPRDGRFDGATYAYADDAPQPSTFTDYGEVLRGLARNDAGP